MLEETVVNVHVSSIYPRKSASAVTVPLLRGRTNRDATISLIAVTKLSLRISIDPSTLKSVVESIG